MYQIFCGLADGRVVMVNRKIDLKLILEKEKDYYICVGYYGLKRLVKEYQAIPMYYETCHKAQIPGITRNKITNRI